jgi:hypothetical protein
MGKEMATNYSNAAKRFLYHFSSDAASHYRHFYPIRKSWIKVDCYNINCQELDVKEEKRRMKAEG